MNEIKDSIQTILEDLKAPVEAAEPAEFDNETVAYYLAARYSNPTLKDELEKNKI